MSDKDLARIAALLRKAEGTDNEHEADAYLQAAQRLATLSAVDLAVARAHTQRKESRVRPTQRTITIGESGKRGLRTYVQLFLAIGRANSLMCDIARDSTRVYAYGFANDIDMVEAMYASLVVQMVRASDAYIKSGDYSRELLIKPIKVPGDGGRRGRDGYQLVAKPVHPTTARISFQEAFAYRIGQRLQAARAEAEASAMRSARSVERAAAGGSANPDTERGARTGVALALRARELELTEHYKAQSRARGSWRGNRATGTYSERSLRAGDAAGRRARLRTEREIGGGPKSIGRG